MRLLQKGCLHSGSGPNRARGVAERIFEGQILDLCAARVERRFSSIPFLAKDDEIVSVDLPGPHFSRLESNLKRMRFQGRVLGRRPIRNRARKEDNLKGSVWMPCSNTGVLQKKPDVVFGP